jgi:quercetin dioxygenase-like cupin family protein
LSGEAIIENVTLSEGDYLYTPVNFKHSVATKKGCTMLFVIPEEVEIL